MQVTYPCKEDRCLCADHAHVLVRLHDLEGGEATGSARKVEAGRVASARQAEAEKGGRRQLLSQGSRNPACPTEGVRGSWEEQAIFQSVQCRLVK